MEDCEETENTPPEEEDTSPPSSTRHACAGYCLDYHCMCAHLNIFVDFYYTSL